MTHEDIRLATRHCDFPLPVRSIASVWYCALALMLGEAEMITSSDDDNTIFARWSTTRLTIERNGAIEIGTPAHTLVRIHPRKDLV